MTFRFSLFGPIAVAAAAAAIPAFAAAPAPAPKSTVPGKLAVSWIGNSLADRGTGLRVPTMLDQFGVWPDGSVWLQSHYNEGGAEVTLLDGRTGKALGRLDGIAAPAPNRPDGSRTYYYLGSRSDGLFWHGFDGKAGDLSNGYSQYANHWTPDRLTREQGKLFPLPFKYATTGIGAGGGVLWVGDATDYGDKQAGGPGRLWLIDARTRKLIRWLPAPGVGRMAVASDGQSAWYAAVSGSALVRVDVRGRQAARIAKTPAPVTGLAALPDGGCLVTGPEWRSVARFSANGERRTDVPLADSFSPKAPSQLGAVPPGTVNWPLGVGVDAAGNLYVACCDGCLPKIVRVDRYPADGKGGWDVARGARVCWGGTFGDLWRADPTDPTLRWSAFAVARMDWNKGPGQEQRLVGVTLDRYHDAVEPRRWIGCQGGAGRSAIGVRVIGGHRYLYTIVGGDWDVYRLPETGRGLVAKPCGMFASRDVAIERADLSSAPPGLPRAGFFWHDADGDGHMTPGAGEYETWQGKADVTGPHEYGVQSVDDAGNVWYGPVHTRTDWTLGPVLKFGYVKNELGDPVYSYDRVRKFPIPQADRYGRIGMTGITSSGDLWVVGRRDGASSYSLAWWPGWTKAGCPETAAPAWVVNDVADTTRSNADWSHWERSVGAVTATGDYVFLCEGIDAAVRVYRRGNGAFVGRMATNIVHNSTQDSSAGMEAVRRGNGEYDITVMGYLANVNVLYRWTPAGGAPAPKPKPAAARKTK